MIKSGGKQQFNFDSLFPPECSQDIVYEEAAKPVIDSVLEGFNGTIFAYGMTGTGKTFTMLGAKDPELRGIIPRSLE